MREAATAAARAELALVVADRDMLRSQARNVAEGVRRLVDDARPLQLGESSTGNEEDGGDASALKQMQAIVHRLSSTIVYR